MTKLSSSAQAVLDAAVGAYEPNVIYEHRISVAAALRAAADQVMPMTDDPEFFVGNCCERNVEQEREDIRSELLAIATELEAHNLPWLSTHG